MTLTPTQQNAANRIYAEAVSGGMPPALATLMVEQSGNETNGWTSNFFVNNNNCFGYSCDPNSKWQNGCSSGNADNGVQVGNYDTIEDSTMEVVDWIYRRLANNDFPDLTTITDADTYAQLLKDNGYYGASESSYAAAIKRWASNLGTSFITAMQNNPGSVLPVVLVVGLGIYFGIKKGLFKKFK